MPPCIVVSPVREFLFPGLPSQGCLPKFPDRKLQPEGRPLGRDPFTLRLKKKHVPGCLIPFFFLASSSSGLQAFESQRIRVLSGKNSSSTLIRPR